MGFGGGGAPSAQPATQPNPAVQAKGALPGAKADASARAGGGISPNFLAGLVSQQTGTAGSGQGILEDIRKSLGE